MASTKALQAPLLNGTGKASKDLSLEEAALTLGALTIGLGMIVALGGVGQHARAAHNSSSNRVFQFRHHPDLPFFLLFQESPPKE